MECGPFGKIMTRGRISAVLRAYVDMGAYVRGGWGTMSAKLFERVLERSGSNEGLRCLVNTTPPMPRSSVRKREGGQINCSGIRSQEADVCKEESIQQDYFLNKKPETRNFYHESLPLLVDTGFEEISSDMTVVCLLEGELGGSDGNESCPTVPFLTSVCSESCLVTTRVSDVIIFSVPRWEKEESTGLSSSTSLEIDDRRGCSIFEMLMGRSRSPVRVVGTVSEQCDHVPDPASSYARRCS